MVNQFSSHNIKNNNNSNNNNSSSNNNNNKKRYETRVMYYGIVLVIIVIKIEGCVSFPHNNANNNVNVVDDGEDDANYYLCQIDGDLTLTPFNGQHFSMFMPVSGAVSSVQSFPDGNTLDTHAQACALKLHIWTTSHQGRFHISGLRFELEHTDSRGRKKRNKGRIRAEVSTNDQDKSDNYEWQVTRTYSRRQRGVLSRRRRGSTSSRTRLRGKETRRLYSKVTEIASKGRRKFRSQITVECVATFHVDATDYLTMTFDCCDQAVSLKPYNPSKPEVPSGLQVKVKRNRNRKFRSDGLPGGYLCGDPDSVLPYEVIAKSLGFSGGLSGALTMIALTQDTTDDLDDVSGSPVNVREVKGQLSRCPKGKLDFVYEETRCLFSNAEIVQTVNSTGTLLSLISDVGAAICQPNLDNFRKCLKARDVIHDLAMTSSNTTVLNVD